MQRAALVEALTGQFDDHHGELARMLHQIDALNRQIDTLSTRIEAVIAEIPAAATAVDATPGEPDHTAPQEQLTAVERLDQIPGISPLGAQVILAEIGLDMARFPTARHLTSWAKLTPRTVQSGARHRAGKTSKGNPYLKGLLGEAAVADGPTRSLGERYRRIVRRRGKQPAA